MKKIISTSYFHAKPKHGSTIADNHDEVVLQETETDLTMSGNSR